jgi:solute carrier family 35 protein E1
MKLNSITLALALASTAACLGSAYSLSPVRTTGAARSTPAFVHAAAAKKSSSTALGAAPSSSAVAVASSTSSSSDDGIMSRRGGASLAGIDIPLISYFALWYLGNYYYNITNKLALKAAGGASGFPLTISALQLGIGSLYGIFLWLAPDARNKPKVTFDDVSC